MREIGKQIDGIISTLDEQVEKYMLAIYSYAISFPKPTIPNLLPILLIPLNNNKIIVIYKNENVPKPKTITKIFTTTLMVTFP
jgi:hypothetical protein